MGQVAFVFQDTRLFKESLLENIRAAWPDASREEVLAAAHAAQCDDILEKLPHGLDTVVGARGVYLSGGEQQRIALARAILKDAPIVVLDEATAFADPENEHQIQKAFETLTRNKTVLMIAHRLSTVQNADSIIVLNEGKIAEQGSHSALLEKKTASTPPCGRTINAAPSGRSERRQRYDKEITAHLRPQREGSQRPGEGRDLVLCVQSGSYVPPSGQSCLQFNTCLAVWRAAAVPRTGSGSMWALPWRCWFYCSSFTGSSTPPSTSPPTGRVLTAG